ncbi:uncharacterized protein LOC128667665 [Microplitis demolitor]|uniref:uncharacterized protein LOC128667665 n=1 Tax=Microplitis demolitor TaxID=69319 RepID=UPI00235B6DD7|nr:uncharacterized protein LOC128667665 [Microplitis demolitor]
MAFVVKDGEVKLIEEVIVQEDASSGEQAVSLEETLADPLSVEVDPLGVPSVIFKEDQWLCCPEPTGMNPEVQSIVEELLVQNQRLIQLQQQQQQQPIDLSASGDQAVEEPVPSTSSGDVELRRLLTQPARPKSTYRRWVRCPAPEGIQATPRIPQKRSIKRKRSELVVGGSQGAPEPRIRPPVFKFLEHSRVRVMCGDTMAVSVPFRVTFVDGHTFPIPFTDPLVGLLAPMTSLEASWLVATMPWPLMDHFVFESLLALIVAMCPMHLWDLAEGSPPRIRIIIEELWDKCSSRVARCVYCGNGRRAQQ